MLPTKTLFVVFLAVLLPVTAVSFVAALNAEDVTAFPFGTSARGSESGVLGDVGAAIITVEANEVPLEEVPVNAVMVELPINENYRDLYPNEARLATFLHDKGLDDMHIAAIIGVFKRESGNGDYDINPGAVEDNYVGHGMAQWSFERWSGANYGRPEQGLKYYAQDAGRNWEDLDIQLNYLWGEMVGEGLAVDYVYVQYDHAGFIATTSLDEAVNYFLSEFMHCCGAHVDDRLDFAESVYAKIRNT